MSTEPSSPPCSPSSTLHTPLCVMRLDGAPQGVEGAGSVVLVEALHHLSGQAEHKLVSVIDVAAEYMGSVRLFKRGSVKPAVVSKWSTRAGSLIENGPGASGGSHAQLSRTSCAELHGEDTRLKCGCRIAALAQLRSASAERHGPRSRHVHRRRALEVKKRPVHRYVR